MVERKKVVGKVRDAHETRGGKPAYSNQYKKRELLFVCCACATESSSTLSLLHALPAFPSFLAGRLTR